MVKLYSNWVNDVIGIVQEYWTVIGHQDFVFTEHHGVVLSVDTSIKKGE